MYLLSNKLTSCQAFEVKDLLDMIFTRIHKRVLLGLLESGTPTVRGAWETLIELTALHRRKDSFLLLLGVAEKYPHWIGLKKHKYLRDAACMGCSRDTINFLLATGARPDVPPTSKYILVDDTFIPTESAVLASIRTGYMDTTRLLIRHCVVNRKTFSQWSTFDIFLQGILRVHPDGELSWLHYQNDEAGLNMLLEAGGEVDKVWEEWPTENNRTPWSGQAIMDNRPLPITLLDYAYYFDIELFRKLDRYSTRYLSELTRSGVCMAAKEGTESLQRYLQSRQPESPEALKQFLECVLFEQIFALEFRIDFNIVRCLINYGVDVKLPSLPRLSINTPLLLCRIIAAARKHGSIQEWGTVVFHLLQEGATVDSRALHAAVEEKGFQLLRILTDDFGADIVKNGARALATAARANNFEAVEWLIQRGADVNGMLTSEHWSVMAGVTYYPNDSLIDSEDEIQHERSYYQQERDQTSPEMLKYLIDQGAKLRIHPSETNAFNFLRHTLLYGPKDEQYKKRFQVFLDTGTDLDDFTNPEDNLLEICLLPGGRLPQTRIPDRLAVFELLFGRGAPLWPGSALALLIHMGGRHHLIREVMDADADINGVPLMRRFRSRRIFTPLEAACRKGDFDLVSDLLQRGADVNAPALGFHGRTVLQSACESETFSTEGELRKTKLIQLLIDYGADVNAEPASIQGVTALEIAATRGDLKTALILLEHKANVNALRVDYGFCALDGAAKSGRLDMVKLLLNMNALSQYRGSTGYDGAIRLAERGGHVAVADLIRKHAADHPGWVESGRQDFHEEDSLPWYLSRKGLVHG